MMKKKVKIFDIVLIVIFTVFSLVMIIPVYKVLVDSFDLKTAYGMKLFLCAGSVCIDPVEDAGAGIYCQCTAVYNDI